MGILQRVMRDPNLNVEPHQYAYGTALGGHQLPDDATEWAQTLDVHVLDPTQTMKAAPLKGSVYNRNNRNKLKYHSGGTVFDIRIAFPNEHYQKSLAYPSL